MSRAPADRVRLARAISGWKPRAIEDRSGAARAAVVLILRQSAGAPGGPGPDSTAPDGPAPPGFAPGDVEGLFVQRAEVAGDPWSGHMALPGGRSDAADADLQETARREAWEETSIDLAAPDFLGRLSDIHPLSAELPSIIVTPFVAWPEREGTVRGNREIRDHVWVPLRALADSSRRTALELVRGPAVRRFPAIEYEGYTIWGLTFVIVQEFLEAVSAVER